MEKTPRIVQGRDVHLYTNRDQEYVYDDKLVPKAQFRDIPIFVEGRDEPYSYFFNDRKAQIRDIPIYVEERDALVFNDEKEKNIVEKREAPAVKDRGPIKKEKQESSSTSCENKCSLKLKDQETDLFARIIAINMNKISNDKKIYCMQEILQVIKKYISVNSKKIP